MKEIATWVINNKEWLFSGLAIALVSWVGNIVYSKKKRLPSQEINSGKNSINIQTGNDVNIKRDNDVEKG